MPSTPQYRPEEMEALFWSRVRPNLLTGCLEWTRAVNSRSGYGVLRGAGIKTTAHRYSWTINYGPLLPGQNVLHHCDNRKCVNPMHLYLGTYQDNANDRERRGRGGQAKRLGENNGRAKLTLEQVQEIRAEYAATPEKHGRMKIGDKYGVTYALVYKIASNQNWKNAHAI